MAAKNHIAYHFDSKDEILMALLSQYPFLSFEELEDSMLGYIIETDYDDEVKSGIANLCTARSVNFTTEIIQPQNWNAQWEASFQPVEVRDFCRIRADFHPATSGFTHDVLINPKMAFGTGHHETTWMMIDAMSRLKLEDQTVLDFGTGTGVLAIIAEKMGSGPVDAIDIETESYLNTTENAAINKCSQIKAYEGELSALKGQSYDVILANINRYVLLTTADQLFLMLLDGGTLLLSGILSTDQDLIVDCYKKAGLNLQSINERGDWRCIQFGK